MKLSTTHTFKTTHRTASRVQLSQFKSQILVLMQLLHLNLLQYLTISMSYATLLTLKLGSTQMYSQLTLKLIVDSS